MPKRTTLTPTAISIGPCIIMEEQFGRMMTALGEVVSAHEQARTDPETPEAEEGTILAREQILLDLLTYLSVAVASAKQWERIAANPAGLLIEIGIQKNRPAWWNEKDEKENDR